MAYKNWDNQSRAFLTTSMAGGTSCLSLTCSIIGILFATVSVAGIGLSLFLVFGEPYSQSNVQGTYSPNWEDIGKYYLHNRVSSKSM